ncbi:MAG TPA: Flp family type IVb pilin [Planctomycetaceae bacterium]|nr:Flp family type IVb pilin [Planctomycetaceae bacterium]
MGRRLLQSARRFLRDESGPTAVEYCVMMMLVLLVCITAVQLVGRAANDNWTNSSNRLQETLGN